MHFPRSRPWVLQSWLEIGVAYFLLSCTPTSESTPDVSTHDEDASPDSVSTDADADQDRTSTFDADDGKPSVCRLGLQVWKGLPGSAAVALLDRGDRNAGFRDRQDRYVVLAASATQMAVLVSGNSLPADVEGHAPPAEPAVVVSASEPDANGEFIVCHRRLPSQIRCRRLLSGAGQLTFDQSITPKAVDPPEDFPYSLGPILEEEGHLNVVGIAHGNWVRGFRLSSVGNFTSAANKVGLPNAAAPTETQGLPVTRGLQAGGDPGRLLLFRGKESDFARLAGLGLFSHWFVPASVPDPTNPPPPAWDLNGLGQTGVMTADFAVYYLGRPEGAGKPRVILKRLEAPGVRPVALGDGFSSFADPLRPFPALFAVGSKEKLPSPTGPAFVAVGSWPQHPLANAPTSTSAVRASMVWLSDAGYVVGHRELPLPSGGEVVSLASWQFQQGAVVPNSWSRMGSGTGKAIAVALTAWLPQAPENTWPALLVMDAWGNASCDEAGPCQNMDPMTCADGNPCTTDLCDAIHGGCYWSPLPDGMACGQGKTCKSGACN